jgi:hypothetical protein
MMIKEKIQRNYPELSGINAEINIAFDMGDWGEAYEDIKFWHSCQVIVYSVLCSKLTDLLHKRLHYKRLVYLIVCASLSLRFNSSSQGRSVTIFITKP